MFPAGGSSNTITAGGSFDVYIQVWMNGVTNAPGQGADITCTLHWGQVASFGGGWSNISSTPMNYHGDIGNNDEYKGTISPPAGLYEFTAYCTDLTDNQSSWQGGGNGRLTVNASSGTITDARAIWLDRTTIAWNGAAGASYKLLYDPDGGMVAATAGATACSSVFSSPCFISLTADGTVSGFAKNPNATGKTRLTNSLSVADAQALLKGQVAVASYNSGDSLIDITGVQIQSVLDAFYAANAKTQTLGVSYSSPPSVKL